MEKILFVYKTTCLVNGKIYVGQRYGHENDSYLGSGVAFLKALKKYGRKNFRREILKVVPTQNLLNIWEQIFIKKLNSCDRKIGYNILKRSLYFGLHGADHPCFGKPCPDETKKKLSKIFKGRRHSEEMKQEISVATKKAFEDPELRAKCALPGERNGMFGHKRDDEFKKKVGDWSREANKGEKNPMHGRTRITNGIENKTILAGEPVPEGWRKGLTCHWKQRY